MASKNKQIHQMTIPEWEAAFNDEDCLLRLIWRVTAGS